VTAGQIIACALALAAAVVAITVLVLARRARRRSVEWKWEADGNAISFDQALTEREVEEFKARWLKAHGNNQGAHHVVRLRPAGEEEPS
jgi:hypothetical protein